MFNKQAWDTHWRLHKCWFTSPENVPSPNPNRTGCRTKCLLRAVSHYDRLPLQHAEHRVAAPVPVFCTTMQTFLRNKNSVCATTHHVMHIDIQSMHEGISLWKDLSVDWKKSGARFWIQSEWVWLFKWCCLSKAMYCMPCKFDWLHSSWTHYIVAMQCQ